MSELEWRSEPKAGKNYSLLSLDKQENTLNPSKKNSKYLAWGLLVFTTQISSFIIPFAICTNAGTLTNLLILTTLIVISTYSISALEPDNPHMDYNNMDLLKKVMSGFWIGLLRNAMFLQYVLYGLLLIFISTETISYIAFDNTSEFKYFLICISSIGIAYILIICLNQENRVLKLGRLTPLVNLLFNGYLIMVCIAYYSKYLKSINIDWQRRYAIFIQHL